MQCSSNYSENVCMHARTHTHAFLYLSAHTSSTYIYTCTRGCMYVSACVGEHYISDHKKLCYKILAYDD